MIEVNLAGLEAFRPYLTEFVGAASKAMSYAMNRVIPGKGRDLYIKDLEAGTAFPPGYLDEARFGVTSLSSPDNLEVHFIARDRPTSLARFINGGGYAGERNVTVTVNPGNSRQLKGSFTVNLPAGNGDGEGSNLGLAIRLKPGQVLRNKKDVGGLVYLAKNVVLLYGASIGQQFAFTEEDDTPQVVDMIADEFYRQFVRLA